MDRWKEITEKRDCKKVSRRRLYTVCGGFWWSWRGYVRELYKGYNIEEISRNNSLAGKTKTSEFKELIIRNYEK